MANVRSNWGVLHPRSTTRPRADWDRLISWLAERQHGVVAVWQLLDGGLTPEAIKVRLRSGRLVPIYRGVFAVGGRRLTRRGEWMAAVLAARPTARSALSDLPAAMLLGLTDVAQAAIHVTVARKCTSPASIHFHRRPLPADERTVCDGIPVTSVNRTILDLAASLPAHRLDRMLDRAARVEHHAGPYLPELLERYPRRPGAPTLRTVLGAREGLARTRSELEDRFLAFLDERGFERPLTNAPVRAGGIPYELGCYWPAQGRAVELDSWEHHSGRRSFREDRVRDRRLRAVGIETTRVTWHDVTAGAEELDRDLRSILARARQPA